MGCQLLLRGRRSHARRLRAIPGVRSRGLESLADAACNDESVFLSWIPLLPNGKSHPLVHGQDARETSTDDDDVQVFPSHMIVHWVGQ